MHSPFISFDQCLIPICNHNTQIAFLKWHVMSFLSFIYKCVFNVDKGIKYLVEFKIKLICNVKMNEGK